MSVKNKLYQHRAILPIGFVMIFFAFGIQYIGMTIGIMALLMQLGFAVGPPVLGRVAAAAGIYTFGFIVYRCLAIVTVEPKFWTPPLQRRQEQHT